MPQPPVSEFARDMHLVQPRGHADKQRARRPKLICIQRPVYLKHRLDLSARYDLMMARGGLAKVGKKHVSTP
jgi:hypothetical protein